MSDQVGSHHANLTVSVRIALYNHENFVVEALESVRNEGFPIKELVIIDDGSPDGSLKAVEEWRRKMQPPFDVIVRSRENKGLCKTLNELIDMCNGDILVSLASDDRLLPGGIAKRVEYLAENPDKDAVIGDCRVIDDKGQKVFNSGISELYNGNLKKYTTDEGLLDEVITNWSVPGSVLAVRKSVYEKVGKYREDLKIEDWDFYIRIVSQNLLGFVPSAVAEYRLHGNNTALSQRNRVQNYLNLMKTAIINLLVVPKSHIFDMLKLIFGFAARYCFYFLKQLVAKSTGRTA